MLRTAVDRCRRQQREGQGNSRKGSKNGVRVPYLCIRRTRMPRQIEFPDEDVVGFDGADVAGKPLRARSILQISRHVDAIGCVDRGAAEPRLWVAARRRKRSSRDWRASRGSITCAPQ
jgi:hypothetical protein